MHHYTERRSYSWYVDIDDLPRLPRWLRPFARFEAVDHFHGAPDDTLRQRVDAVLAAHGIRLPGGQITALLLPRVLGRACNPLSLFWCHDAAGALRCVVAEIHNADGQRDAYVLPSDGHNSPFDGVDGHYVIHAPRPGDELDLRTSLHRGNQFALVGTVRGARRPASVGQILRLQVTAPLAPQMTALSMRLQALVLRLRGVPVGPRPAEQPERLPNAVSMHPAPGWTARSWMPS